MKCEVNCVSGTIMMPPLPGKSSGYLIVCPTCRGVGAATSEIRLAVRSFASSLPARTPRPFVEARAS